ncbi:hypothetical protein X797_003844 [Metarhizium robertsii]|uniref:Extracellular membrane protein, CFEM domain protein n=2 Tax=Metarhizium robertsii TaxID=568076 RepID=E9EVI6_METRA|nr:Extracellular membrane protein, CFEM domain protein [Metarhizium robertsii ARSEF 23]EFZ00258.1 Extracellular membrane protein, CFEM domain protein [Metarhizium robertsii ARSEF 23]EXV02722.1 hypothetical protein X797_003844 [Metarhizium robertsii]
MKTTVVAAAALLATVSAQSLCAVDCFQSVVTEHPPLSCREASMYLCFCKGKDLQNYFAECAYSKCGDNAQDAVNFGVSLCKDMGVPIDPPTRPVNPATSQAPAVTTPSTTSNAPVDTAVKSSPENDVTTILNAASTATSAAASAVASTVVPPVQGHSSQASSIIATVTQQPFQTTNQTGAQPTSSGVVTAAGVNLKLGTAMLGAMCVGAAAVQLL